MITNESDSPIPISTNTTSFIVPIKNQRPSFRFQELNSRFPGFQHKETQEYLFKWGMKDNCYIKRYTYDQYFQPYQINDFLLDFFNYAKIDVKGPMDEWKKLSNVKNISSKETLHSITSLAFFKRLRKPITRNGEIKKCLDEYHNNFLVSDLLRKCLIMEDSDEYSLFSESERDEFIFHLFKSLCLGGKLCQYEDALDRYLETTKKIYKDLISVGKDQKGELVVTSHVYQILSAGDDKNDLFPIEHVQNFCYVCIDPINRYVNLFYHAAEAYY